MERALFNNLLWLWTIVGFLIFILLLFVTAPYGRHSRKDWGPSIPNRVAWIIMEAPSLIIFILAFLLGPNGIQPVTWIFFAIYVFHYGNRSILWPLRTKTSGKQMPLVIALMAIVFNLANGFSNGYYFSAFAREYTWEWLFDIRFILGFIVWGLGVFINWWSDQTLLNLRRGGRKGYFIPYGGLFRWVSCPNFFGEILEWTGFAIMTWSPAALVFALWSFFNLVPRALDHHKWYKATFPDYPIQRKAVIPFTV
jgi:3-oxo-5-alpha-steroid 4-dehydrogenase 1